MPTPEIQNQAIFAELAEQVCSVENVQRAAVTAAFVNLRAVDPELAQLALDVFGTDELAGEYFARAKGGAERTNGYAILAEGKRDAVVNALIAVAHGMIT